MKNLKKLVNELRSFLILWSTQALSALGSSMTGFALIMVLSAKGIRADNSAAVRMFLRAVCDDEHFCGRAER